MKPADLEALSTINQLVDAATAAFGAKPSLGLAGETPLSFEELRRRVLLLAAQLRELGVKRHDRVAILADSSPQWGIAYLAAMRLAATAVPILPDFPEADIRHILAETEAKVLFTNQRQLEKLYELAGGRLKTMVTLDDATDPNRQLPVTTFSDMLASGAALPERKRELPPDPAHPEDLASIIYTSGTSGHSKAVMLSHANLLHNARSTIAIFERERIVDWTFLSILPMSHAYEFTAGFLVPIATGSRVVYAGKIPTPSILERICREARPTVICMVPMVMEKIYKKKVLPAISRGLTAKAMRLPLVRGRILRVIGNRIKSFFGGRLKVVAIGGAPLNIEVERFLAHSGFPYLVGYGLTEASPLVSAGPYHDVAIPLGSAGRPVRDVTVRIAHPNPETGLGEILVKGPNVMQGYRDNPQATAETLLPGDWLSTGDLGLLDQQGYLFIKGRSKSVIVLSHGENIYPEPIEEKINTFQHVVESLVMEHDNRLIAKVYLDYELIDAETRGKNQQQQKEHIDAILGSIKAQVNRQLPLYSQLASISEHREPFIKTATHKIKRYLYTTAP
ncbi:MAG: AMP-binding protein [Thermodesulfobacteriota bacterium]